MNNKLCKLCKLEKVVTDFYLCGGRYSSRCKKCFSIYQKNNQNKKINSKRYRDKNQRVLNEKRRRMYHKDIENSRKSNREYRKKYRKENPEYVKRESKKRKEYQKQYRNNHKQETYNYNQEYYKNNSERLKRYQKENKDTINKNRALRHKERYKNDPTYKLNCILRSRFRKAISKGFKYSSCIKYLGCSIEECRKHLESQFKEGMSWNNYGLKGWHIDHIKPCASFDLSDIKQQEECFNYTNMQPLWWYENLSKGSKSRMGS